MKNDKVLKRNHEEKLRGVTGVNPDRFETSMKSRVTELRGNVFCRYQKWAADRATCLVAAGKVITGELNAEPVASSLQSDVVTAHAAPRF